MSMKPIINMETTLKTLSEVKEGQTHPPATMTTIASFLDGITKYVGGNEYHVQELLMYMKDIVTTMIRNICLGF
jgi:hypothetical protein